MAPEDVHCPRCGLQNGFSLTETVHHSATRTGLSCRFLDCTCDNCGIGISNAIDDEHTAKVTQEEWEAIVSMDKPVESSQMKYLVHYGYLEDTGVEPPFERIAGMKILDSKADAEDFTVSEMKKGYDWWHRIYSAKELTLIDERGMVED